jgi:hypothetical protein
LLDLNLCPFGDLLVDAGACYYPTHSQRPKGQFWPAGSALATHRSRRRHSHSAATVAIASAPPRPCAVGSLPQSPAGSRLLRVRVTQVQAA